MPVKFILVRNYRCLKDVHLKLKKLNIIWGLNGTGKSSIFESIYLLKQYTQKKLNFQGPFSTEFDIDFGSYNDIFKKGESEEQITLYFEVPIGKKSTQRISSILNEINHVLLEMNMPSELFEIIGKPFNSIGYRYCFSIEDNNLIYDITYLRGNSDTEEIVSFQTVFDEVGREKLKYKIPSILAETTEIHPSSTYPLSHLEYRNIELYNKLAKIYADLIDIFNKIFISILNRYYILRPMRATIPTKTSTISLPEWVGLCGDYVIEFLSHIWSSRKYENIKNKIQYWAGEFGLKKLSAGWFDQNYLKADFMDPETGAILNLSFAGTGSRQLLPIIIQLFNSPKGSMIVIEEPEISLHLEWQCKIFEMFYDAIKEGKQIVITTHSPDFIPILENFLKNHKDMIKDTIVYHLDKKQDGSTAKEIKISAEGNLKKYPNSIKNAQQDLIAKFFVKLPSNEE